MEILDGQALAQQHLLALQAQVAQLPTKPVIAAVLFTDDPGSVLYSDLKQQAADQVGIVYRLFPVTIAAGVEPVLELISQLKADASVTGIIIQKPRRSFWQQAYQLDPNGSIKEHRAAFRQWWRVMTQAIPLHQDVDGLNPVVLQQLAHKDQPLPVLPATAKAVLRVVASLGLVLPAIEPYPITFNTQVRPNSKIAVIGKSDIVGMPIFTYLANRTQLSLELLGRAELADRVEQTKFLHDFDIVISATGSSQVLSADFFRSGVVAIDVGEPKPDINPNGLDQVAAFLSPVPGGIGPLTVANLLDNAVQLAKS